MHPTSPTPKTIVLTTLAMIAFAANALLCRMALGEGMIDAASFTLIRLGSGALVLLPLAVLRSERRTPASSASDHSPRIEIGPPPGADGLTAILSPRNRTWSP